MAIIELKNISKTYDDIHALNSVSLELEKGKVYGLIGRNGAGKSTLLKIISDLILKSEGDITIDEQYSNLKHEIMLARDYELMYNSQKLKDLLKIAEYIYPRYNKKLEEELVKGFDLNTKKTYQKSSKGMQTMVSLIIALCSDAKVLLLDEPYAGLDPINREFFYKVLKEYYFNEEKTVVISSHLISEIEGYFEEAIIIDKGEIIVSESLEEIYSHSFVIEGTNEVLEWLRKNKNVLSYERVMNVNKIYIHDSLSGSDKAKIDELNGQLKGMDLQTLMIKLVTREEVAR